MAKTINILFLIGFLFLSGDVFAKEKGIIITEIMYSPEGADSGREWIEIYNLSNKTITIDKKTLGLIDEPIEYGEDVKLKNTCHTFDADLEVAPKDFAVITDKRSSFLEDYLWYENILLDSVIKLLNSKDEIKISFDRCKTWEAEAVYSSDWGADGTGNTLEKIKLNNDNSENNWQESFVEGGTPGKKSSEKQEPKAYSNKIRINELFPNPNESPEKQYEFIELYNYGDKHVDLGGWLVEDKTRRNKNPIKLSGTINPSDYIVFYGKIALNNSNEGVWLRDPNEDDIDYAAYGATQEGYSYSYDGKSWLWTSHKTPGEENKFDEEKEKEYLDRVYLNEILPNPSGNEKTEEFIEIYNSSKSEASLSGWILKDSSKSGRYVFPEGAKIKDKGFLVVYRSDFKFALNNSGKENVYLLDPNGKTVSVLAYSKAKEAVSYNFDGEKWRWSKYLTSGKKNKFNNLPAIEIKVDKKAYKNVYVNFEVKINDPDKDKIKVTWNFGDNRKSYKKKTRHKYKETGEFNASVKIFDGSEEITEKFKIKVGKFPSPKVRIVSLMPNPSGKDSEREWIRVKNKSKKEVNLKNWSIATGRNSKKMINHPIYDDLIIKSGKEAIITRELSKFSLNNKKSRIELRYPNGKVAHKAKYKNKDGVEENEVYEKRKGEGWIWIKNIKTKKQENIKAGKDMNAEIIKGRKEYEEIPNEFIGKQSGHEGKNKIVLAAYDANKKLFGSMIDSRGKVLGAAIIKIDNAAYVFTGNTNYRKSDHYAVKFIKSVFWKVNQIISDFLG